MRLASSSRVVVFALTRRQLSVKRLANVLSQTMRQWGLKEDIYPIGHTAKFAGTLEIVLAG
jgi:hypothetical protein